VLKNKSLVIVSILVLVMAVVAMGCAPAAAPETPAAPPAAPETPAAPPEAPETPAAPPETPATPAAPAVVEKETSYKSVKYEDPTYNFSVAYPEGWTAGEVKLQGGVFYAKGEGKDLLYVAVRPATEFKSTANVFLADLIKLSGAAFTPSIDSETKITLADGTEADVIQLSAAFGMAKATITGVLKDGNAIMVMAGTDPKHMDLYKEIGSTLILK
jgi:hypothetical protein